MTENDRPGALPLAPHGSRRLTSTLPSKLNAYFYRVVTGTRATSGRKSLRLLRRGRRTGGDDHSDDRLARTHKFSHLALEAGNGAREVLEWHAGP